MRLELGDLYKTPMSIENSSTIIGEDFKLTMVSDSIVPSTPQRVEEIVPVQQTPVNINTNQEQKKEEIVEPVKEDVETKIDNSHPEKDEVQTHLTSDSVRQSTSRTPVAKAEAVESEPIPVQSSRSLAIPVTPVDQTTIADDVSTTQYPIIADTIAHMDTVNLAEVKELKQGMSEYTLDSQKEGLSLPIKLDRSDGLFALLVICFLLLAHVYQGGISFFKENVMLVFSASKSERIESQTTTKEIFYSYFLVFLAVFLVSIALYEGLDRLMPLPEGEKHPFVTIGLFMILMLGFIFIKLAFNRFIGYIFDLDKRINTWNRSYIVLLSMLGLLCFFPTLMLIYSNLWHSIIIGFVLILFLIVQIILFIRIIIFFIEERFNFLYLIAYLCTVEIIPYIFLGIGLVYLYKIDIFNTVL